MKKITSKKELFEIVDGNNQSSVVILKVGTSFCGQYSAMERNIEEIEKDFPDIIFLSVTMDDADDDFVDYITDELEITHVPVCVKYHNGFTESGWDGYKTVSELKETLSKL